MSKLIFFSLKVVFIIAEFIGTFYFFQKPLNDFLNNGYHAGGSNPSTDSIFSILIFIFYLVLRILFINYRKLNSILLIFLNTHQFFIQIVGNISGGNSVIINALYICV